MPTNKCSESLSLIHSFWKWFLVFQYHHWISYVVFSSTYSESLYIYINQAANILFWHIQLDLSLSSMNTFDMIFTNLMKTTSVGSFLVTHLSLNISQIASTVSFLLTDWTTLSLVYWTLKKTNLKYVVTDGMIIGGSSGMKPPSFVHNRSIFF